MRVGRMSQRIINENMGCKGLSWIQQVLKNVIAFQIPLKHQTKEQTGDNICS